MNKVAPIFNQIESPLRGINLIEASAGTGKTYAISCLVVRMIAETNIPVDKILIVTFTNAATEELKMKVREKLRQTASVFAGECSDDEFAKSFYAKHRGSDEERKIVHRIAVAINDFDTASILTIHSFCQQALAENAFESGSLFELKTIKDQLDIIKEIVYDFWRNHFYMAEPEIALYITNKKITPAKLIQSYSQISDHHAVIMPSPEQFDKNEFEQKIAVARALFAEIKKEWAARRDEIVGKINHKKALKKQTYSEEAIATAVEQMDFFVTAENLQPVLFGKFELFCRTTVEICITKYFKYSDVADPFFDLCEELKTSCGVFDEYLLHLKVELIHTVKKELSERKEEKGLLFFDDMLQRLYHAIHSDSGEKLIVALQACFHAVLIDEFQDTDSIQYAIFKKIFFNNTIFMVGDPKQAIYAFRGADVFTYMRAVHDVENRYLLNQNWRSAPACVDAVNILFSQNDFPFILEGIKFHEIQAAKTDSVGLKIGGACVAPFHLCYLEKEETSADGTKPSKQISKGEARKIIAKEVATQIASLCEAGKNNRALIGDVPLKPSDIALIARNHYEIALMRENLLRLGIPCVSHSSRSVFEADIAQELLIIISAILSPHDARFVRAALATSIIARDANFIAQLTEEESMLSAACEKFSHYRKAWHEKGFIKMFFEIADDMDIFLNAVHRPLRERVVTDITHLAELLHSESYSRALPPLALKKWFENVLTEASSTSLKDADNPMRMRLESDELAVKLMTVHASKGLEFPIVFCPFMWGEPKQSSDIISFHDPNDGYQHKYFINSDDCSEDQKSIAYNEVRAEEVRLLYVALTRAKYGCYLFDGDISGADKSSLVKIINSSGVERREAFKKLAQENSATFSFKSFTPKASVGADGFSAYGETEELGCLNITAKIEPSWELTSFSAIISSRKIYAETPDYDEEYLHADSNKHNTVNSDNNSIEGVVSRADINDVQNASYQTDIFSFPGGITAGNFFHKLLEKTDFTADSKIIEKAIAANLVLFGFDASWSGTILSTVETLKALPLTAVGKDFCLAQLSANARLVEMEFCFPLQKISTNKLKKIFSSPAENINLNWKQKLGELRFLPMQGFMKGFIDMIFYHSGKYYIVDWKSNHLGNSINSYSIDKLATVMIDSYYVLQYHIYALALHLYLKNRITNYDYEKHFGGVYYIFLRGLSAQNNTGIYYTLPSLQIITQMEESLVDY